MVIYRITNIINGKIYVGKDLYNDPEYTGSGILIQEAIKKYGRSNFKKDILETVEHRDLLNEREKFWIRELNAQDRSIGYNIHDGGDGGNTFGGKHHSEESKRKSKESNLKTWESQELRERHSVLMKEISSRDDVKEKIKSYWTEEKRLNRSNLIKNSWTSEKREKMSQFMKEKKKKPIVCDGIRYESITDANEKLGISWYLLTKKLNDTTIDNWYRL
jgi:group I intron endonuclease